MSGWPGGSTRQWRTIRRAILMRDAGRGCRAHDEGWCSMAGVAAHVCIGTATVVHHTLGRARTGDDHRHMVASCTPCNLAIGDPGAGGDPPNVGVTRWG